jgi:transposase
MLGFGPDRAMVHHVEVNTVRVAVLLILKLRKRHIAVDVLGLLLTVLVTAASVQDRDAGKPLLWNLRKAFPQVKLAWADGGSAGKLVTWAKTALKRTLQIVNHPRDLHTFQVLPRRWVVERTLAWITRHRCIVHDYGRPPAHHET